MAKKLDFEQIMEVARSEGFSNFEMKLEGWGEFFLFSNEEGLFRRYNLSGQKVGHDYFPKRISNKADYSRFVNPVEIISNDLPSSRINQFTGRNPVYPAR